MVHKKRGYLRTLVFASQPVGHDDCFGPVAIGATGWPLRVERFFFYS